MIKKIEIDNFRGIYNTRSISFLANAKRIKNKIGITKKNNKEILLVNCLLGKNASGKSSFIDAIEYIEALASGRLYKSVMNYLERKKSKSQNKDDKKIIMNIKTKEIMNLILKNDFNDLNKPLKFYIEFIDSNSIVSLLLHLNNKGMVKEVIKRNEKKIFERNVNIEFFKSKLSDIDFKKVEFHKDISIIDEIIGKRFFDWSKILNKISKEKILDWIRIADEKIIKIMWNSKNQIDSYIINMNNKQKKITSSELSVGTTKWLAIGASVFRSFLVKQSFLFIDEIDRALHPFLLNFLISMFNDLKINKKRSQLLFTSHSPLSVEKPFRKDAINFIDDLGKIINVGSLKVREDLNITKNFVSEKLCSHPYKSDMFEWAQDFYE